MILLLSERKSERGTIEMSPLLFLGWGRCRGGREVVWHRLTRTTSSPPSTAHGIIRSRRTQLPEIRQSSVCPRNQKQPSVSRTTFYNGEIRLPRVGPYVYHVFLRSRNIDPFPPSVLNDYELPPLAIKVLCSADRIPVPASAGELQRGKSALTARGDSERSLIPPICIDPPPERRRPAS